tara:strand:+ start:1024 stop:1269 length:246 start_codon:yes stop_codon:yes gene_type:complete
MKLEKIQNDLIKRIQKSSSKKINIKKDLFIGGYLDSFSAINLILDLEKRYNIKLKLNHSDNNWFRNVETISIEINKLINKK